MSHVCPNDAAPQQDPIDPFEARVEAVAVLLEQRDHLKEQLQQPNLSDHQKEQLRRRLAAVEHSLVAQEQHVLELQAECQQLRQDDHVVELLILLAVVISIIAFLRWSRR